MRTAGLLLKWTVTVVAGVCIVIMVVAVSWTIQQLVLRTLR